MAEKTFEELTVELVELKSKIDAEKELRDKLVADFKASQANTEVFKARRNEINLLLKTVRSTDKIAKKEAHLAELLKAKEEAEKLGISLSGKKKVDTQMPVAAHRSESVSEIVEGGSLSDPVSLDNLESELDLF
jgi:recombinational DNA repair ATPase RecF